MITDKLKNAALYYAANSNFEKAFDFIKTLRENTPNGSYQITDTMVAHVMEYTTGETFQYGWEAHKKFIDIQYCLRGQERIIWTPLDERLTPSIEYDEENDRTFFTGNAENTSIDTGKQIFALFFPEDAHAPQICLGKPIKIKKVVIKVPL